ncbi:hypothetical protein ACQEU3_29575 [Spirillospora sp. CA-253888]
MPIRVLFSTPRLHDGAWAEEAVLDADRILVSDGLLLLLDNGEILAEVPVEAVAEIELKAPRRPRKPRKSRSSSDTEAAPEEPKAYSVDGIRAEHAQAYRPWDAEQERKLLEMHDAGASHEEIGTALGRQPSAIGSRLRRLRGR